MRIRLPYGEGFLEAELPKHARVIYSRTPSGVPKERADRLVEEALNRPVGSPRLEDLARGAGSVAILVTDRTRATPLELLLRGVVPRLRKAGVPRSGIRIVVATGLHTPHTPGEIRRLIGGFADEYEALSHDAEDRGSLRYLGTTRFGTPVEVNRLVVEADLVVGLGLLEPHFFAGYSGGRKLILPGVAGAASIYRNHSYSMLSHPRADYGVLDGNPVHEDMVEAARMVRGYRFAVHTILDREKRVVEVVAGDPYESHRVGVEILDRYVKIPAPGGSDVVVVTNGGYPLDRDLYQGVKGIVTGSRIARRGGVVILVAECRDGVGHEGFRELMAMGRSPRDILEYIRANEPIRDQWEAQKLAQVLLRNRVVVVTKGVDHGILEEMKLTPASSLEEAMEIACRETGCRRIAVVPEGPYVIPEPMNRSARS
ncbi:MAG: nickel-dependent lactate racemase [Thermoprotei archaeon]|nr:MAG: nickel-dependent lactate racemase [Thermoprotei archaeon]